MRRGSNRAADENGDGADFRNVASSDPQPDVALVEHERGEIEAPLRSSLAASARQEFRRELNEVSPFNRVARV